MELPITTTAESLYIIGICQPIRSPHIALQCHIVDILVHIQQVANLAICFLGVCLSQTSCQFQQLFPRFVVTYFLVILGIAQVELVHIVEVDTIVAVGKVLIVALADVEHPIILSVQEDMSGLIVLTIDIESAA